MKKFNILICLFALVILITSCRDEETYPIVDFTSGGLVKATIPPENSFFNAADISNAQVIMNLIATDKENGNLIEAYEIYSGYIDVSEEDSELEPVLIKTVNTFPSTVNVTVAEIVQALNIPGGIESLEPGDIFPMTMTVVMKDGRRFDASNSSSDVVNQPNSRGTFKYDAFIACPFDVNEMVGTYEVVVDSWEVGTGEDFEIIAGPGENQYTMVRVFGFDHNVIVDVDPLSGASIVAKQESWDPAFWGFPASYGKGYADGPGTTFSCVGSASFNFTYSVDIGTFGGVHQYAIKKK